MGRNDRPNILIAMSDNHSACAPPPSLAHHTPTLQRMAREGVVFGEARTPTPMCAPARASLMSGLYAQRHGMWNNNHTPAAMRLDIASGVRLWSESLRAAGYRLRYTGKWHVSATRSPEAFGWEVPVGAAQAGAASLPRRYAQQTKGAGLSHARYVDRIGWPQHLLYGARSEGRTADEALTDHAVELIQEQASWHEPWCLYVGWIAPHDPYVAPTRCVQCYQPAEIAKPASYDDSLQDKPRLYRRLREEIWPMGWEDASEMLRHYYGMITLIDEQLGRLLEALRSTGQDENTLVIYTSDHGDLCGGHGLFTMGLAAFEETYRIPLLMRWPAGISAPGRSVVARVGLQDIGPTILDLAGAQALQGIDGRSLAPFLHSSAEAGPAWSEYYGVFMGQENFYTQRVVWAQRYKYVWNTFDYDELYDLAADPHELVNLARKEKYDGVLRQMAGRMWHWAGRTGDIIGNRYPTNALLKYGPADASIRDTTG